MTFCEISIPTAIFLPYLRQYLDDEAKETNSIYNGSGDVGVKDSLTNGDVPQGRKLEDAYSEGVVNGRDRGDRCTPEASGDRYVSEGVIESDSGDRCTSKAAVDRCVSEGVVIGSELGDRSAPEVYGDGDKSDDADSVVDALLSASEVFHAKNEFPVDVNRCKHLVGKQKVATAELSRDIKASYPILHEAVVHLICAFMTVKKNHGTEKEKEFYRVSDQQLLG